MLTRDKLMDLALFIGVALLTALFQTAAEFDPARIADPAVYAIGLGGFLVREIGKAGVQWLARTLIRDEDG